MKQKNLLIFLCSLLFAPAAFAQTWDGSAGTSWNTPANWSTNTVPLTTGSVIIPGSLTNYPVLSASVTINSIDMRAGSRLDFNGFSLTTTSASSDYNYLIGATLNNSNAATDIVINISTAPGYHTYVRSATVNDNITFNFTGPASFYEADNAGTGNRYTGNVTFNYASTGALYLSQGDTSFYNGNLVISRTGAGLTDAFNSGGVIGGNFSFTNNTAGNSLFGIVSRKTSIAGTVNIAINDTTPGSFELLRLVNQTAGGAINVQNSRGFDIRNDTLIVSALSVTGYQGADYGYLYENKITGNISFVESPAHVAGYHTYARANDITGNTGFTMASSTTLYEADNAATGNRYTGNVTITASGTGALYLSDGDTSSYNGNLVISRTGAGLTDAFNGGGIIGGNFSFINNTAGNSLFGITSRKTSIAGTVNIAINNTTPGGFEMLRLVNQTAGGAINVQNSRGFDIRNDTLIVSALSVTGYQGADYGYLFENNITGNVTITDGAAHVAGYHTYIRANIIAGNTSFANNGPTTFYDADNAGTGNKYIGNLSYATSGSAINVASSDTNEVSGNLALNSASGISLNWLKFNGTTNGTIEQTGTQPIIIPQLIMEKTGTGRITLNDSVTVPTSLFFNGGNILSTAASKLIFLDNATHTGSSAASHVAGPVTKNGNDAFTFPTGTLTTLNPVTITAPAAGAVFSAQYINSNPDNDGYDTSMRAATLLRISGCEYWDVQRVAGTSSVNLTLGFGQPCVSAVYITDPSKIRVARWTGSTWENLGNGGSTGTTSGTISTAGAVSNFSPFTLASVDIIANPLPVQLTMFTVIKKREGAYLQWQTENEINFSHFEIEKSKDGNRFASVGLVNANNTPVFNQYALLDKAPYSGINFYRLKMVDKNGKINYSKIETVLFSGALAISIFPNPGKDEIKILSANNIKTIEVTDVSGKLIKRMTVSADNRYNVSDLKHGIYIIKVTDEEKTHVSKLLIQ
ncbi:MAG: T9SS type A sorting domain-containing protein [Ferruginibacter sp.]